MAMKKKNHGINIPGVMLDQIRDSEDQYEHDERFNKRQKLNKKGNGKSIFNRKENRKKERMAKKNQKNENKAVHKAKAIEFFKKRKAPTNNGKSHSALTGRTEKPVKKVKKSVSFSSHDDIREIPPRPNKYDNDEDTAEDDERSHIDLDFQKWEKEAIDDSEDSEQYSSPSSDDSQDEAEEKDAHNLIEKLKQLKKLQRGEWDDNLASDDSDNEEISGEDEELDEEQQNVMAQLTKLKGKRANSDVRIVKEDELNDDDSAFESVDEELVSENSDNENSDTELLDDEQQDIMDQLKALKGPRKTSDIKIVKEDELLEDDSMEQSDGEEEKSDVSEDFEDLDDEQRSVMEQLAKAKGKVSKSAIKIINEDELEDDSMDEVDLSDESGEIESLDEEQQDIMDQLMAMKGKRSKSEIKIVKEDELSEDSLDEQEQSEENSTSSESEDEYVAPPSKFDEDVSYYADKLGISSKTSLKQQDPDDLVGGLFDGLDFMNDYENDASADKKKEARKSKKKDHEEDEDYAIPIDFDSKKDEEEMEYYARKLGIDPKKGLKKQDEFDDIGGLFEGLETYPEDEIIEESEDESEEEKPKTYRSSGDGDDAINSDDFDDEDDLDEDDKALLKEMYGLESSESESDYESEDDGQPRVKENPYVAPGQDEGTRYIPPALRKKLEGENEELTKITRLIKGPFNKLSESTLHNVIGELNKVFEENPRQYVNEAILNVMLKSIVTNTPMLDTFLILYASAVVGIYKMIGVEFGAFIVQKIIEKLVEGVEGGLSRQENINLSGFVGYLYSLNFFNCGLIYDIIKFKLIQGPNELKTDVLLKLIKSCGGKLRSDDSNALNEIIIELNKSISGTEVNVRTRFLIDTITDLKNNRLKNENVNSLNMLNRIKKQLGNINSGRNLESIKVSLDDIEHIEERGKWWLVGSAWKGKETSKEVLSNKIDDVEINDFKDEVLGEETNWMELARQCRMNTDIRKAIFISIMSAEDFMDSFTKLEKLNLKKAQKKEIANILLHCATMEETYNPYYGYLSKKLCDDHILRREFQLNLWDFLKEIENDEDEDSTSILVDCDEDTRLWKIVNLGRFFGFLIGEGSLSLNILRVVNFLTATSDVKIFIEMVLVSMIENIGKKSVVSGKGKNTVFNDNIIIKTVQKCEEQPLLRKGLMYFLEKHVVASPLATKSPAAQRRLKWGVEVFIKELKV